MITILQVDGSFRLAKMCGAYPNEPAALARNMIGENSPPPRTRRTKRTEIKR
jgi:hypothetical protein